MRRLSAERRPAVKIALPRSAAMLQRMIVGRLIGWLFLLTGLGVFGRDMMHAAANQVWEPVALGDLWHRVSPGSYSALASVVEQSMGNYSWRVVDALLAVWAFAALILIGVGLLIAFRRRRDVIQR